MRANLRFFLLVAGSCFHTVAGQRLRGVGDENRLHPVGTGYQDDYNVGLYLHLRGKGGGVGGDHSEKAKFCESLWGSGEFELCPRTAVCPNGPEKIALYLDTVYMDAVAKLVPPQRAEQWAAISDGDNTWVGISHNATCMVQHPYKFPPTYSAFTYCCRKDSPVWYDRSAGWGATEVKTYKDAAEFCKNKGKELCPRKKYCPDGPHDAPFLGRKWGNQWAPTSDDYNDWVQIGTWMNGDLQETCQDHNDRFGYKPKWGEEGITHSTGYILCCPSSTNTTEEKTSMPLQGHVEAYL